MFHFLQLLYGMYFNGRGIPGLFKAIEVISGTHTVNELTCDEEMLSSFVMASFMVASQN